MFSRLFRKPKPQPIPTHELKPAPLPMKLQSLLQNKTVRRIYQVGAKTCLITKKYIIVYDPKSKKSPKKYKLPGNCWQAVPWSEEVILLNCEPPNYRIYSFNLSSGLFSEVKNYQEAIGKLKWGNDEILVTNNGTISPAQTFFYKANDLSNLELLTKIMGGYDGFGKISQDQSAFVMHDWQQMRVVSCKDGEINISTTTNPKKLATNYLCATRKNGYVFADHKEFKLTDDEFKIIASAKPISTGRNVVVLPNQQHFIYHHEKDCLIMIKFKEKTKPKAKDELETTIFKFPGQVVHFVMDVDNAKLITCLKNGKNYSLHICEDFQPLLEHRQKLRQEFDSARSAIASSMYGNRDTHAPDDLINIVTDYAFKPRP